MRSRSSGARLRTPLDDQLLHVDGLALGRERAGLDPAQAEQVGDEAVEAIDLVAHGGEQLDAGDVVVLDAVAQVGGDGPDRRERRAQVVGHRAQQRAALVVERLELLGAGRPRARAGCARRAAARRAGRARAPAPTPRSTSVRRCPRRVTSSPTSRRRPRTRPSSVPSSTLAMSRPPYGRMNARSRERGRHRGDDRRDARRRRRRADDHDHEDEQRRVAEVSWSRTGSERQADAHGGHHAEHARRAPERSGARDVGPRRRSLTRSLRRGRARLDGILDGRRGSLGT